MRVKNYLRTILYMAVFLSFQPCMAHASVSAYTIYQQAKSGDVSYFNILRRYPSAVDLTDNSGNTAYCIAMRNKDIKTMNFLANHGANTQHDCVKTELKRQHYAQQKQKLAQSSPYAGYTRPPYRNDGFFSSDKNIWYTVGGVALVGGAAALALNKDESKKHSSAEPYLDPYLPSDNEEVNEFRTAEYKKTNALGGIRAAEAYSVIYDKDENGKWVSHQANSTNPLEKVKVGVLDSGVYANNDLAGKVVHGYDLNSYNTASSMWGYVSGNNEFYVLKKDSKYYGVGILNGKYTYFQKSATELGLTSDELNEMLNKYLGVTINNFSLMNGSGGYGPGEDMSEMLVDASYPGASALSWLNLVYNTSHGTHVSGLIAGNKNDVDGHGVAFENAQIYAASWDFEHRFLDTVKDMVDDGVKVINNSWGQPAIFYTAKDIEKFMDTSSQEGMSTYEFIDTVYAYAYAADKGAVWVQSTGNEHNSDAQLYNGLGRLNLSAYGYSGAGQYEAPYLAVAALDLSKATASAPSGVIASYSNRCGSASAYCIAAPGTDVSSAAAVESGSVSMNGTSMATPLVSGSIALLKGYYPWLSAQNVAYLLLETANNTGKYANRSIYGRGALDLERAISKPVGELGLPETESFASMTSITHNKLALSGPIQKKLQKNLPKTVTAFDALNRPFQYNTANLVSETHGSNAHLRNAVSHAAMSGRKQIIKDEKSGFQFTKSEALNKGGQANLSTVEVLHETENGSNRFYYTQNSRYMTPESVVTANNNPYFAMNEAYGAENTLKLSDSSKLKLSLQTGKNGMYERDYEQDRQSFDERSYGFGAEYSFNLTDYLEISTLGGMLYEEDAMLGMNGRGGFAIKDGSTYYMGLKAALNLTPNITLLAAYYRGYTQGQDATMLSISDLQTESFMIAGEYKFNGRDKVGLSLSSPLSVAKGRSTFRYASGRDNYSDTIYMQKLTNSLKPAAKEYDLGMYYLGQPEDDLNVTGKVEARFNADGEKGLTDYLGIMGMQYNFPK